MKGTQAVENGWKAYRRGDVIQAETEFSKAVSQNSKAAYALLQRGLFQLRLDHFAEASRCFQAAAEKEPKNPAPLFFLTLSHELEGETTSAEICLEKLSQLCPHHQGLTSLRLLREIRRGDPLPVLHLLGFGEKARGYGLLRMAAAGLGMGDPAWLAPDLSSSPYLLGPILVEVEKRLLPLELQTLEHRAEDLILMLTELKPVKRGLIEELKNLPASWKAAPKLRKGRRLLEKAWGIEDLDAQKRVINESITLLEQGQALDPYSFRTSYHLGEAYLFSAKCPPGQPYEREPLLKAETWFIDSARNDGLNPYVLLYLALIQQLLGRPQPAIDCYRKATEKFTKLPEAHYGMGQCHLLLGDLAQAREMLLRAVNSDLALARDRLVLLANLLAKEGKEALARPLPAMPAAPEPPTEETTTAQASPKEEPGEAAPPVDTSSAEPAAKATIKPAPPLEDPPTAVL